MTELNKAKKWLLDNNIGDEHMRFSNKYPSDLMMQFSAHLEQENAELKEFEKEHKRLKELLETILEKAKDAQYHGEASFPYFISYVKDKIIEELDK